MYLARIASIYYVISDSINYQNCIFTHEQKKLSIYDFIENKEIQYMNIRSIVLKIGVIKFLDRGCSKIVCPKLVFWSKQFWAQPLSFEFLTSIFLQYEYIIY
ncbi:hypothetical protein CNEO4_170037 [Clostridium neonatale]|uniref:Uncharacterized protein n=1 Tax=Clostridium neonatale TaxID=137838 RepID=A0AA86K0R2_9CLOT|nr:hypothetical protein CNEO_43029 [Clostridium neonatale]CAG9712252.1 hypothetical protein CNEO_450003 [Clostridium neonatale]CAI3207158.1 hypothetical protein CNEO2_390056 [Clostridium neonatale]CAI3209147.1 hypothetical protein CNEO2_560005 [Clostridium neonatale]CAI3215968.1 hypothetical protein CNEO2_870023 [Clostridium neonatale]